MLNSSKSLHPHPITPEIHGSLELIVLPKMLLKDTFLSTCVVFKLSLAYKTLGTGISRDLWLLTITQMAIADSNRCGEPNLLKGTFAL